MTKVNIAFSVDEVNLRTVEEINPPRIYFLARNHAAVDGVVVYNDLLLEKLAAVPGIHTTFHLTDGFKKSGARSVRCYVTCERDSVKMPVYYAPEDLKKNQELQFTWEVKCVACKADINGAQIQPVQAEPTPPTPPLFESDFEALNQIFIRASEESQRVLRDFFNELIGNEDPMAAVREQRVEISAMLAQSWLNLFPAINQNGNGGSNDNQHDDNPEGQQGEQNERGIRGHLSGRGRAAFDQTNRNRGPRRAGRRPRGSRQ